MNIPFHKYHGTGNDFILIDNREQLVQPEQTERFAAWMHRRFGVGADGLILLNQKAGYDFEMDYYNSDGKRSSMCGNGGRCITQFALDLGIIESSTRFLAIDGTHVAEVVPEGISLEMIEPYGFSKRSETDYWLHTGSPHYVTFQETPVSELIIIEAARKIRYSPEFSEAGTNVNFVNVVNESTLQIRTYERGVEDETYSCGTGVVAAAEIYRKTLSEAPERIQLLTQGGTLWVESPPGTPPRLIGPATFVFQGSIEM